MTGNVRHFRRVSGLAVENWLGARAVLVSVRFDQAVVIGSGRQRRVLRAIGVNGVRYDAAGLLAPGSANAAGSSSSGWSGQELVIAYSSAPVYSAFTYRGSAIHGTLCCADGIGTSSSQTFQAYTNTGISTDPQGNASYLTDQSPQGPQLNYSLNLVYNEHDQSQPPIACNVNNSAWTCSDSRTQNSTTNPNCWNPSNPDESPASAIGPFAQNGQDAGVDGHCGWAVDQYTFTTAGSSG